jgi:hypothetical protein
MRTVLLNALVLLLAGIERAAKDAGDFTFVCRNNSCSKRSANDKHLILAAYSNPIKKILKTQQKKSTGFVKKP